MQYYCNRENGKRFHARDHTITSTKANDGKQRTEANNTRNRLLCAAIRPTRTSTGHRLFMGWGEAENENHLPQRDAQRSDYERRMKKKYIANNMLGESRLHIFEVYIYFCSL